MICHKAGPTGRVFSMSSSEELSARMASCRLDDDYAASLDGVFIGGEAYRVSVEHFGGPIVRLSAVGIRGDVFEYDFDWRVDAEIETARNALAVWAARTNINFGNGRM
jgi:hypothetical protein